MPRVKKPPLKLSELNRTQKECLLALEDAAVLHGGKVKGALLTEAEHAIAVIWSMEGFIKFGNFDNLEIYSHFVELTPEAITMAHEYRLELIAQNKQLADRQIRGGAWKHGKET